MEKSSTEVDKHFIYQRVFPWQTMRTLFSLILLLLQISSQLVARASSETIGEKIFKKIGELHDHYTFTYVFAFICLKLVHKIISA